ncbi:major facilitator superfamily domain-containing protein [Penicillium vulpinum]|nr:major facilitator superfamily domain-containing protein [Penicillium vulpinum]KAJ5950535.1 major facilitator superfamily domain-containing protein [Penicillium vulpinum]
MSAHYVESLENGHAGQRSRLFDHPQSNFVTGSECIVGFDGPSDPYQPRNWPSRKKLLTTALYGLITMTATWTTSIYSPAVDEISQAFGVSKEVSLLGLSFCLLEFGPLVWAPLSEVYGRKWPVLVPCAAAAIFSFGAGAAKDIQTILICRFFTGFFGSAPVSNTGGVLSDIYSPTARGYAIMSYSLAVIVGPTLGPLVGSALVESHLGWRWTQYLAGILQISIVLIGALILEESYEPVLLIRKAKYLRATTGNWALHTEFEEWIGNITLKYYFNKFGIRPVQMLLTPICFLVALHASFIFGVFYATLAAFPILFDQTRHWNSVVGSLAFLALLVGILLGAIVVALGQYHYNHVYMAAGGVTVPEARLPPMMIGSFVFAAGLFILGWTANPSIPWIVSFIGAGCVGFGFFTVFQSALNYLLDVFNRWGASAIAANTFLRSTLAAVFPLFIDSMYQALGNGPATSVFGGFAVLLIPIPFFFWIWGPRIRSSGKYTFNVG